MKVAAAPDAVEHAFTGTGVPLAAGPQTLLSGLGKPNGESSSAVEYGPMQPW
jgi:hypothetical protein